MTHTIQQVIEKLEGMPFTNAALREATAMLKAREEAMTNEQKAREAFEAWLANKDPRPFRPNAYDDQEYKWAGWQARAAYESARTQQVMGDGSATIAPMSDASAPITPATQQDECPGDKARRDNVGKNTPPNVIYETLGGDKNPAAASLVSSILWNLNSNGWAFVKESQSPTITTITVLKQAREGLASVKCDMYDSAPLGADVCEEVEESLTAIDNELKRLGVV